MNIEDSIKKLIKKIFDIEATLVSSSEYRFLFMESNFLLDISIDENTLILETISIPEEKRHKGLTTEFIKNMIDIAKNDSSFDKFKVCAVVSSYLSKICLKLNFEHEEFHYPDFDIEEYDDFDGFYGSYLIELKKH